MAREKSLQNFLDGEGRLLRFPAKRAMQQAALTYLAGKFQPGTAYTERQVNELLGQWHTFRDPYGTAYQLSESPPEQEE